MDAKSFEDLVARVGLISTLLSHGIMTVMEVALTAFMKKPNELSGMLVMTWTGPLTLTPKDLSAYKQKNLGCLPDFLLDH